MTGILGKKTLMKFAVPLSKNIFSQLETRAILNGKCLEVGPEPQEQ